MDWHTDWAKAKQEVSDASKRYATWVSMPDNMRLSIGVAEYRRRKSEARKALKRADELCRSAGIAARRASRAGSQTAHA